MDLKIEVTVHMFIEDKLYDESLVPGSDNYGIMGKNITLPLREINGRAYNLNEVDELFTVQELWDWFKSKLQEYKFRLGCYNDRDELKSFDPGCKFLVFNNLRYAVRYTQKPVLCYLREMGVSETDRVDVQILVSANAGEVFNKDGIRYYIYSNEDCGHNIPHVHVSIQNEVQGSFSILDGRQLAGDRIKGKHLRKIREMILSRREKLLGYWEQHTNGLTVDLNQALGLVEY